MKRFIDAVVAMGNNKAINNKITKVLMKTLENIAFERVGKEAPYDDSEIFSEIISLKAESSNIKKKLSDESALASIGLFEEWNPKVAYEKGDRFYYNGNLYRCKAPNPINPSWTPDIVHDYYEPVAKPTENGTPESPVTAVAGMEYEIGKYYTENGKIYLCTREGMSAGEKITLHYLPSALVGQYFTET